jgi:ABC-type transporter Mla subunit MlaD
MCAKKVTVEGIRVGRVTSIVLSLERTDVALVQ